MAIFLQLVDGLGLIALFSTLVIFVERTRQQNLTGLSVRVLYGIALGFLVVVSMLDPIRLTEGATFDPRGGPAILAGVFGGPIGAVIAALMGSAVRWFVVGGPVALGGVVGFLLYGVFGILIGRVVQKYDLTLTWLHLVIIGLLGTLSVLPSFFVSADIPTAIIILKKAGLILTINNVLSCIIVGTVIIQIQTWMQLRARIKKLDAQTLMLSRIADETVNGVVVTDKFGMVEWVNRGFERISGYSLSDLVGKSPGSVLQRDDIGEKNKALMRDARQSTKPFQVTVLNYSKAGKPYWVDISCQPFITNNGHLKFMAIETDVTERVRSQHLLQVAKEEAEAASVAKSNFVANMSHELRTPLNGIVGMTTLLQKGDITESQKMQLEILKSSADHLTVVVNDILDISKIEASQIVLERIDFELIQLINTILASFRPAAEDKGLALIFKNHTSEKHMVRGDPTRLRQIMTNLISNAVKFTEAGRVTFTLEMLEAVSMDEQPPLRLKFSIRDTGIGIPSAMLESVFDKFTQAEESTTRKFGGTGLGLKISQQIAELMGGSIAVESTHGAGSTFIVNVILETSHDDLS